MSTQILHMAVQWAKNLPSFASLPFRDQVILLEESWPELFLLYAMQCSLPFESAPLFSAAELTALTLSPPPQSHPALHYSGVGKPSQVSADVRHLHDTFYRYKSMMIEAHEFACMKAIALFRPGKRILPTFRSTAVCGEKLLSARRSFFLQKPEDSKTPA